MTTTVAERLRQGAGYIDRVVSNVREPLSECAADVDAGLARAVRQARRGMERASDVRDEARIAIKRHPFAATALAFGIGALIGVVAGRLAATCTRDAAAMRNAAQRNEPDFEW